MSTRAVAKKERFRDEVELARLVRAWLIEQRWDVYQEVRVSYGGPRADLVAVRGAVVWVVETKLRLGLPVVEQAMRWRRVAHYVSVAAQGRCGVCLTRLLKGEGIGWIIPSPSEHCCVERIAPRLFRRAAAHIIRRQLCDAQRTYARAGNAISAYWSPWRETCRQTLEFIRAHPGCTLKELVDGIRHHYSASATARTSLAKYLRQGIIPGVTGRLDDRRRYRLYAGEKS